MIDGSSGESCRENKPEGGAVAKAVAKLRATWKNTTLVSEDTRSYAELRKINIESNAYYIYNFIYSYCIYDILVLPSS